MALTQTSASVESERERILREAFEDPVFFCKFFLKHLFPEPVPWVHRGLFAILLRRCSFLEKYGEMDKILSNFVEPEDIEDENSPVHPIFFYEDGRLRMRIKRFTQIMMPRGYAKTTIAGNAVPIIKILYQEVPFFAYLSEAAPHAKMQLDVVKGELSTNEKIEEFFGPQRPKITDAEKWSDSFFETLNGCAMAARGRGGQVRGLKHKENRPVEIICDDLEDKESVATEEQRQKVRTWFFGDVVPALPRLNPNRTITVLGTLLHPDALLVRLAHDPRFTVVKMEAIDRDGAPLWPQNMSLRDIQLEKLAYQQQGELSLFYMEYFNRVADEESRLFKQRYFQQGPAPDDVMNAIYIDPAISQDRRADSTVIAVAGISEKGQIFVQEMWGKQGAEPREMIDEFFRLSIRYKCVRWGVESVAWQRALVHLMQEEMFRRHHYFEVTAVTHGRVKKEERIRGILHPRYSSGYVVHTKRFPELESQMLDFPGAKHDDYPDALSGAIALLDPYAAMAADDSIDLSADEYKELDEELDGEWRDAP